MPATIDDINSTLQNIARQLGAQAQSQANAVPNATASASPVTYAISLSTTAATVAASSTVRYGLVFHNPGTANVYVYPTGNVYLFPALTTTAPTTSVVQGSIIIYPGGTLSFPSPEFPNVNVGWSAFSGTGSSQAFTIVEFY